MPFDLDKLVRDNIREMTPYSSARTEHHTSKVNGGVLMDANENAFGSTASDGRNRYPDPQQHDLRAKIASFKGVSAERVFVGNGSDESIDLLFRAFCRPEIEQAIIMPPTYGMYAITAQINDVILREVPLTRDFEIDQAGLDEAINANTKLIFVCSPNNPTGNCLSQETMRSILEGFTGIVVVDEAYIDYADGKGMMPFLDQYPNLVVLQTFSKAWGMANLRLGMAFASKEIVAILDRIKPPYNVSGLTQEMALIALDNAELMQDMARATAIERNWLIRELVKLPFVIKVFPSQTNFLLIKMRRAAPLYAHLSKKQVFVRNHSQSIHCENCLRVTVGTPQENRQLIKALKEFKA